MAARATQETEILNVAQALAFVERHGVVCESARRGTIPVLVDVIAGASIRGNWWSHPQSRDIFAITRAVRDAPQILVCKLVDDKITFVHERVWPALVHLADRFPQARLARVREVHTANGKHLLEETLFPDWVPKLALSLAKSMSDDEAEALLRPLLCESVRPARRRTTPKSQGR